MSLEQGGRTGEPILWITPKWSWRSCEPEQLLGDSSILDQLATLLRASRVWGKFPESLHGLHPSPNQASLHSHLWHLPTIPSCRMRMRPTELYLTHFYSTMAGGAVGGLQRASGILKAEQAHFIFLCEKNKKKWDVDIPNSQGLCCNQWLSFQASHLEL